MNQSLRSFFRRLLKDQRAQVLPVMAVMMAGFMGLSAFVVDIGHLLYCSQVLQATTNAAALAGSQSLPNTTATTVATTYSAVSGGLNAQPALPNVTMSSGYPMMMCIQALVTQAVPCVAPANANAIVVQQQMNVKMYFAGIFGIPSELLTATAAASMRGGATPPYNVAIIVDTSASMADKDSSASSCTTRITCALSGVQTLLSDLSPCSSSVSACGTATNGNVANSVDRVSLFVFPNVISTTVSNAYDCSTSTPTAEPYTFPSPTATSLSPMPYTTTITRGGTTTTTTNNVTYQILDFSSDYRLSDMATSLNSASNLTIAAGGGKKGCPGLGAPGGEGTYYAGVIYAAQAALVAEQTANPGSQNVIILLGDGDVSASQSQMATGSSSTTVATASGLYPSWVNQCQQAITAGQAATAAGTRVYSVAYGAALSGCGTDKPTLSPCQTMQQIASSPATFFSDHASTSSTSNSCLSSARPTTNLNEIFTEISGDFTVSRLIPNSMITGS